MLSSAGMILRSRVAVAPRVQCGYAVILRRQLVEHGRLGRTTGNKKLPTKQAERPKPKATPKPAKSHWDESSMVQRGPVPKLFYIRHESTLLQPQYSGKSAWAGLGALTGVNLVVLAMWNVADNEKSDADEEYMMQNFTTDFTNIKDGRPWTLATASISHIDLGHFAGNMFAMWLFGFYTYRVIGTAAFYGLYLAGGLACSATHVVHNLVTGKTQPPLSKPERDQFEAVAKELQTRYGPHVNIMDKLPPTMTQRLATADKPSLGASGSVMAISAVAAALFPLDQMRFRNMYLPLPMAVGIFVLTDLTGLISEGSPTDHAGHLGGLLFGALYVTAAWYSKRFGSFKLLSNITGGELPIVYRYRQMFKK